MNSSRKLQVFVSSTYLDLRVERQAAVEAILQAGHIPAGMELFAAGNESQMEVIRDWIDQSDALLLILGERYGSLEPKSKKSYTQLEYEYAVEKGKKVFAVVLHPEWIGRKFSELHAEATDDFRKQYKSFKKAVLERMSAFVKDPKDIAIEVGKALARIAKDESLIGWIRADDYANNQALIIELRKTVEELRARPQSGLPSAAEIAKDAIARLDELMTLWITETGRYQNPNNAVTYQYTVGGNAASLVLDISPYLRSGIRKSEKVNPKTVAFLSRVNPLLDLWGMTSVVGGVVFSTPKGDLLISFLESAFETDRTRYSLSSYETPL